MYNKSHILAKGVVCMCERESRDIDMAVIIEQIIQYENRSNNEMLKIQEKRIASLLEIQRRQNEGKRIQEKRIIDRLISSGILDENGDFAFPYDEMD